jgi:hypothetical protein
MLKRPITILSLSLLATGCLLTGQHGFAQTQQIETARVWGDPGGLSGHNCETTMAMLDNLAIDDQESGDKSRAIIVIARPGRGEVSRTLIRRRLSQVAEYLNRRVSKEKIITAEGDRVAGLGLIEFYVGGKLHTVFKMKRNRDLIKGCYSG